ncbi:peptidylprolyl isomerase [Aegicerativicinus sediminis]|uniref:peptidylprolyl isomerase n=1 Tax=Aegicerativicinus sediminis TaxID=2893202 RepID=UPI00293BA82A|nr:peptidylprolyl isomerase [Aegicerativicinus sediminis]
MKFINKPVVRIFVLLAIFIGQFGFSQEIIEEPQEEVKKVETPSPYNKVKIDGVAGVVGEYVILNSDIDKEFIQLRARGASIADITRCQLFGKLLEDKLYAHHAIQDSLEINEVEIRSMIDQQLAQFVEQTGSLDEVLRFYNKDSEQALRAEMFEINKNGKLAMEMQRKIIEDIEVTPEEVRQYFNAIPKEERPVFGTELQVSQIVVIPEVTEEARQKVIDRLKEMKADVIENGASFTTKAVFYSDDTGSKAQGGKYTLNKSRPQMVKEFRDVAFSLQEGEISDPFPTEYGYHIIFLEKIRGQEYDIRHILLRPEISRESQEKAKAEIDKVRESLVKGELTFADAAREFSDEKETKFNGGHLINPETQDYNFELTKMDPELYSQIQNLKEGEISPVYQDEDRVNRLKYKILSVSNRVDEHEADFARDYLKIKNLALQDKQYQEIGKWQEEKINDTYIKINGEYRNCEFSSNWLKNQ